MEVTAPNDWTEGEEVLGIHVYDSDPLVYRYQCRCCGKEHRMMLRTSIEPTLCHVCTDAIPKERIRRAVVRWVDERG